MVGYSIDFRCRNCAHFGKMSVPKGIVLNQMPCPNCGCNSLEAYRYSRPFDPEENFFEEEDVRLEV